MAIVRADAIGAAVARVATGEGSALPSTTLVPSRCGVGPSFSASRGSLFLRPLLSRNCRRRNDDARQRRARPIRATLETSAAPKPQQRSRSDAPAVLWEATTSTGERGFSWEGLGAIIRDADGAGRSTREKLRTAIRSAAELLPRLPASDLVSANRVPGCTARVWLTAELRHDGTVHFRADSDSDLTRSICAVLVNYLDGVHHEQLLSASENDISAMVEGVAKSTTWYTILSSMQKRVRRLLAEQTTTASVISDPFPSLIITADDIEARGAFAEAQVNFLTPNAEKVRQLADVLAEKQVGVVAHFYMDPEVQGVLVAAKKRWPHIHISDSLVMAEHAVKMADAGCAHIAVLGVDFMSENVREILNRNGHRGVRVHRMSSGDIGCSLAEAAQSEGYLEYLRAAARTPKSLHVIYINTSLETKARAQALVPTITCTSSNVLQTLLQASAQVPDLTVWYGPDSYMGANLAEILVRLMSMTDDEIAKVHPAHDRKSVARILGHLQYYQEGMCIVHDLFGKEVVEKLRESYTDAFHTAHLEVPGEMFTLAMDARSRGRGAVGSTQDILNFIKLKVREVLDEGEGATPPKFILGTESGMITSIVEAVRALLLEDRARRGARAPSVGVEIVFPVSSDAVMRLPPAPATAGVQVSGLQIVPGVTSGEGCSANGGCASCVYMKMNRLDSLLRVCRLIGTPGETLLLAHEPQTLDQRIGEQNVADLGSAPILQMRYFQQNKRLSDELVDDISRHGVANPIG